MGARKEIKKAAKIEMRLIEKLKETDEVSLARWRELEALLQSFKDRK